MVHSKIIFHLPQDGCMYLHCGAGVPAPFRGRPGRVLGPGSSKRSQSAKGPRYTDPKVPTHEPGPFLLLLQFSCYYVVGIVVILPVTIII